MRSPKNEQVEQRHERRAVDRKRDLQQVAVVEEDRDEHQPEADGDPDAPGARRGPGASHRPSPTRRRGSRAPTGARARPGRSDRSGCGPERTRVIIADPRLRVRGADQAGLGRRRRFRFRRRIAASKSALARGAAADPPWPPFSTKTTTTIWGSVDGREAREPGVVLEQRPSAWLTPVSCPTTCAVPVLPPMSSPGTRDAYAVPPGSLTTAHIPFLDDLRLFRRERRCPACVSAL